MKRTSSVTIMFACRCGMERQGRDAGVHYLEVEDKARERKYQNKNF
jgi:hypothetical protein